MYVFVDKKTKAVLHVANASPGDARKPEEIFRGFDPKTMDAGRAPDDFIPVHFDIRDGIVVNLDPPSTETLDQARARKKQEFTSQSLALRSAIAPDYQLLDAGLGLYDDARVATLKATVNAFRDEVNRLEGLIAAAKSVGDLDALTATFPTALVTPKVKPASGKSK
jgi:hypothetical protein